MICTRTQGGKQKMLEPECARPGRSNGLASGDF
jgi:hypothetical protein